MPSSNLSLNCFCQINNWPPHWRTPHTSHCFLRSTLLRYIYTNIYIPILNVWFNAFWKCIHPCNCYHNKNVEHFHRLPNSHVSLRSHPPSTTTNIGLRQPCYSFCHSRLVLPFQEFYINGIICQILSFQKVNWKARETPSNRMGVAGVNLLGQLALAQPGLEVASCWASMAPSSPQAAFLCGMLYSLPLLLPHPWSLMSSLGPLLPTEKVNNKWNPWKSIFAEEFANLWGEPDRKCVHLVLTSIPDHVNSPFPLLPAQE